jgi:hypothetical protein
MLTLALLFWFARCEEIAPPTIGPGCELAVQAAHTYGVHLHDRNGDGVLTLDDIAPSAINFGMHLLDDAPRDGKLTLTELKNKWNLQAPWWKKSASWATSFFTSYYTPERVFSDCASPATPTVITMADYVARRNTTCMETCGKAEDVFNFLGGTFGRMQ